MFIKFSVTVEDLIKGFLARNLNNVVVLCLLVDYAQKPGLGSKSSDLKFRVLPPGEIERFWVP